MRLTRPRLLHELALTWQLIGCAGSAPPPESAKASQPAEPAPQRAEPVPSNDPSGTTAETEAAAKPDMPPAGSSVDRVMRAHFKDALLIRRAVIAGKPEDAANAATVLALIENLDDLPAGWRPFVERMQADARRVRDSTSAAQAAAATADLGVSCGSCHQKLGGPKASSELPPASGTTVEARMKGHVWASERLWEALTVPSSEAWSIGAKTLSTAPFPDEVLKRGGVHARSAAAEFAKLVNKAPAKKTAEERAALYAELLVTCGACHRSMTDAGAK